MSAPIAPDSVAVTAAAASREPSELVQVGYRITANPERTDGHPLTTTRRHKPQTRTNDLRHIAKQLSPREWEILARLREHRFLTTKHLIGLLFTDGHTAASAPVIARRTLGRLRERRLLGTLERRIGGVRAGSSGLVYYLSERGHRLLADDAGRSVRRRTTEPSTTFLAHTLAIADTRLRLVDAERTGGLEVVLVAIETAAWRRHLTPTGALATLKPDLYIELAIPPGSDELRTMFIEVDLGTEHLPTLIRKCHAYGTYAASGQADHDGGMPLVVWSLSARTPERAERRREQLRDVIARDARLDPAMFHITTPDTLTTVLLHRTGQKGDAL